MVRPEFDVLTLEATAAVAAAAPEDEEADKLLAEDIVSPCMLVVTVSGVAEAVNLVVG